MFHSSASVQPDAVASTVVVTAIFAGTVKYPSYSVGDSVEAVKADIRSCYCLEGGRLVTVSDKGPAVLGGKLGMLDYFFVEANIIESTIRDVPMDKSLSIRKPEFSSNYESSRSCCDGNEAEVVTGPNSQRADKVTVFMDFFMLSSLTDNEGEDLLQLFSTLIAVGSFIDGIFIDLLISIDLRDFDTLGFQDRSDALVVCAMCGCGCLSIGGVVILSTYLYMSLSSLNLPTGNTGDSMLLLWLGSFKYYYLLNMILLFLSMFFVQIAIFYVVRYKYLNPMRANDTDSYFGMFSLFMVIALISWTLLFGFGKMLFDKHLNLVKQAKQIILKE